MPAAVASSGFYEFDWLWKKRKPGCVLHLFWGGTKSVPQHKRSPSVTLMIWIVALNNPDFLLQRFSHWDLRCAIVLHLSVWAEQLEPGCERGSKTERSRIGVYTQTVGESPSVYPVWPGENTVLPSAWSHMMRNATVGRLFISPQLDFTFSFKLIYCSFPLISMYIHYKTFSLMLVEGLLSE